MELNFIRTYTYKTEYSYLLLILKDISFLEIEATLGYFNKDNKWVERSKIKYHGTFEKYLKTFKHFKFKLVDQKKEKVFKRTEPDNPKQVKLF